MNRNHCNSVNIKRKADSNKGNEDRKKQRLSYKHICNETEYFIKDGKRCVRPYIYKHETFCKQRWYDRMLFEVYTKEFGAYSKEYYKQAITDGMIRVNGNKVSCEYILKNGDRITHTVHRHEPPVPYYPISIIGSNQDVFAVNKPASIPVHACGAFRYNTLEMIIRKELTSDEFYFIHRLDRVTSGVLLIAKKKEIASQLSNELQKGGCHKVYLAVVEGAFSSVVEKEGITPIENGGIAVDRNIATVSQREGLMKVDGTEGKHAYTYIFPLYYAEKENKTVVQCLPITGRTHQIRLHLQYCDHPIDDDFVYNQNVLVERHEKKETLQIQEKKQLEGLSEEEAAVQNCQWCKMKEDDMLTALFKEEQVQHTSIHLHAYSYTIQNTTFQTELPDWTIFKNVDPDWLKKQLEKNKQLVTEIEKKQSHS